MFMTAPTMPENPVIFLSWSRRPRVKSFLDREHAWLTGIRLYRIVFVPQVPR